MAASYVSTFPSDHTGGFAEEVLRDIKSLMSANDDLTLDQAIAIQAVGAQRQMVDMVHLLSQEVEAVSENLRHRNGRS